MLTSFGRLSERARVHAAWASAGSAPCNLAFWMPESMVYPCLLLYVDCVTVQVICTHLKCT